MGLPLTRDITASADVAIPSTAFNNVQDAVVGKKHGSVSKYFPISNPGDLSWIEGGVQGNDTVKPQCDLLLEPGTRITALEFGTEVSGGVAISGQLLAIPNAGGAPTVVETATSTTTTGSETVSFSSSMPYTIPAGYRVRISFTTGDAGHTLYGANATYERP